MSTRRELAALLDVAQRDYSDSYPFLLTLARTGLRLGEAVGLEWRDVHLGERVLHVRRSVRKNRVSLPKNGKPRRVDVSPMLAECQQACARSRPLSRAQRHACPRAMLPGAASRR